MYDIVIVGGDGKIGQFLTPRLRAENLDVVSTSKKWPPTEGCIPFNLEFPCILPWATMYIFSTGINGFADCEANPDGAWRINVLRPVQTARRLYRLYDPRIVYLSSAAAETHPDTVYGSTKREAEWGFLKLGSAIYRFGAVAFPGRDVYPNEVYCPINLSTIGQLMVDAFFHFEPGLHRITNRDWKPEQETAPVERLDVGVYT